jgi:Transposase DDE domain group 1
MRANQLWLWFASMAYVLLDASRRFGLRHTQFAVATCGTIRLRLLKIGVQVRTSVRRIKVAMASACPHQTEYHLAYLYLQAHRLLSAPASVPGCSRTSKTWLIRRHPYPPSAVPTNHQRHASRSLIRHSP